VLSDQLTELYCVIRSVNRK